jgi:hypothetical protein
MRKNLEKIADKLHMRISRDQEHLARLREGTNEADDLVRTAQALADESRRLVEQLRVTAK